MDHHAPRVTRDPAAARPVPSRQGGDGWVQGNSVLSTAYPGRRRGLWAAAACLFLLAAPGCVLLDTCKTCKADDPPLPGEVLQVVTTWSNKVHYAPDPVNGGVPTPGFVGRLYLFGREIDFPQVGDGGLCVELYDDTGGHPGGVLLEQWNFDADTLHRLLRKDIVGWGYTLFLPWGSYRPDVTRVHLSARYVPQTGTPLYNPGSTVTLDHSATPAGHGPVTAGSVPPKQLPPQPQPQLQPPAQWPAPTPLPYPRAVP